jgi:hypothetical protein
MGEEEVNPFRTYVIVEGLQGGLFSDDTYEEFAAKIEVGGEFIKFNSVANGRTLVPNMITRHRIIGYADVSRQTPPDVQQMEAQTMSLEDFNRLREEMGEEPIETPIAQAG